MIAGKLLKHLISTVAVGGLAVALAVGGLAANAASLTGDAPPPGPALATIQPKPVVETDLQRRERLNARLQAMIRSGEGARLTDPRPSQARSAAARPAPSPARTRSAESRPAATVAARGPTRAETSTIAPPMQRTTANNYAGGRYRPPVLDLRTPPKVPGSDLECLTQALYYEARNESEAGQAAVAEVVINRSRRAGYPKSICEVVYQRNSRTCQFTFTCDGSIGRGAVNMNAWGRAERIARDVYEGRARPQLPTHSVNYHANYVRPSWGRRLERVRQIGAHIFYGAPLNGQGTPGAETPTTARPSERGLQFVRIEALDRAFAALSAPPPAANP